jgi:RNA polymerase sigma-70 factor (ECF subfamily)
MGDRQVEEPDPATIRAAIDGDLDAFDELIRAYQLPVVRFLRNFLGDRELADDVAQETFLRVFRRLPTYAFGAKFSTWLFQVARNAAVDAIRSNVRRDRLVADLRAVHGPPRTTAAPGAGLEVAVFLATLPDRLREALLLVEVLGLTYREAGAVLDVPTGTVKSRVHHAREHAAAWSVADEPGAGRTHGPAPDGLTGEADA